VSALVLGADGTVWLRREDTRERTVDWMVLDGGGRVLATVSAPSELAVHWATRDAVRGVLPDELDTPRIVRYRVRPANTR
jgi:hypothetical protein